MTIKTAAALAEILEAVEQGSRFIYTDIPANNHGLAASNRAFKEADLAARGYKKRPGVWIKAD